jgi:hypothetical protein
VAGEQAIILFPLHPRCTRNTTLAASRALKSAIQKNVDRVATILEVDISHVSESDRAINAINPA